MYNNVPNGSTLDLGTNLICVSLAHRMQEIRVESPSSLAPLQYVADRSQGRRCLADAYEGRPTIQGLHRPALPSIKDYGAEYSGFAHDHFALGGAFLIVRLRGIASPRQSADRIVSTLPSENTGGQDGIHQIRQRPFLLHAKP